MYIHVIKNQSIVLPDITSEDLLVYGIRKFKHCFQVINVKETISREGGEWAFIYDGKINNIMQLFRHKIAFSVQISPP